MKEKDILDLKIDSLSPEARGMTECDGKRVFVRNALPGEEVKAEILEVHKNTVAAKAVKVIKSSPDRVHDEDEKWAREGYARLANLKYDKQLEFKQNRVEKLLKKVGLENIKVNKTIASPKQREYRNQLTLPVREVDHRLELGFYEPRTNNFVPLDSSILADDRIVNTMLGVRDVLRDLKIPAYNPNDNTGFIRDISIRRSDSNNGMIVTLVAREKDRPDLPEIVGLITERLHDINGVVLNFNPHHVSTTYSDSNIPLWGNDYIEDVVDDVNFKISPKSFFQSNSNQVRNIVDLAIKLADLKSTDRLIDAFCGVGTIGLVASKKVKDVRGIENSEVAITDARENIKNNQIENAHYYAGSVEEILARWAKSKENADVIIADPPKHGLSKGFISVASKMAPRKIVYVSKNPDTMARDLKRFAEKGYHCSEITPIDIAPQTPDMKLICALEK